MDNLNSKQMVKALNLMKKEAYNLMNSAITPDMMGKLTETQKEQVKQMKKDLKSLDKKGLNVNSSIFDKLK
jgi:hypothetical protein